MRSEIDERRGPMDNTAVFGARGRRFEPQLGRYCLGTKFGIEFSLSLSLSD